MRLPANGLSSGQSARASSMQRARDGSVLWWGNFDTPGPSAVVASGVAVPITVAVSPARPGHAITVEYRVNGGPVCQAIGLPEPYANKAGARMFRALLPSQTRGSVEFLPVLRFASQPISPRLVESADCPRYQVSCDVLPTADTSMSPSAALTGEPRWAWGTRFLGSVTVSLRKEIVGATPDGLRINWHATEGNFIGPGLDAIVLPGAVDWMRIRPDGIGVVNVNACIETRTCTRIYTYYSGIFDLGPEGYRRALRDEFDPLPPFVITPTYATIDKQLAWLNRAQCIGVGRVDMRALRAEYDVHVVDVGSRNM